MYGKDNLLLVFISTWYSYLNCVLQSSAMLTQGSTEEEKVNVSPSSPFHAPTPPPELTGRHYILVNQANKHKQSLAVSQVRFGF